MDSFNLDYSAANRDDCQDPRDGSLPHDPSLMGFSNNYAFSAMLPQDDLSLPSFDRPPGAQGDLEGRLSNVMLTSYDSVPNTGVSMPMNLDAGSAFAYDVPTTYPATSMGLAPSMDRQHLHSAFSPFPQSLPHASQYLEQPSVPQAREESFNTGPNSTGSYEDSDFSRASERSQARVPRPIQERPRPTQYGQPASYRAPQPVAIQPKKPVAVKGEFCAQRVDPLAVTHKTDASPTLQRIGHLGFQRPMLARQSTLASTQTVALISLGSW